MQLRMVRDDGEEMVFHGYDHDGWSIPSGGLQDFLSLPLDIQTSANVLTDGSTLVSKRVGECERDVSVVYDGDGDPRAVRDAALSFFNPKHSFEAHVEYLGVTRWCECELADVLFRINDESWPCVGDFTLLCLDPYLRSEDGHEHAFGDATGTFGWPFISVTDAIVPGAKRVPVGFPISVLVYDGINTIYNAGDVSTTYTVRIEAKGFLRNPTITKDGRFVKVLVDMEVGQVLVIDFQKTPPTVELDGSNIIGLCSRDSSFTHMAMQTGANLFTFTIDNMENYALADVQILYNDRYTGV